MDFARIADIVFALTSQCLMEHELQEVFFVEPPKAWLALQPFCAPNSDRSPACRVLGSRSGCIDSDFTGVNKMVCKQAPVAQPSPKPACQTGAGLRMVSGLRQSFANREATKDWGNGQEDR
jgi:hypothetical protein